MHIGSVHNKIEDYLPPEFCLPRSSRGNFLKVPSAGLVSDISEDQDQQQDQDQDHSSHQISQEDLAVGIPILHDEITVEVTTEDGESLSHNPPQEDEFQFGEEPFVWTVAERESCFYNSDSDE